MSTSFSKCNTSLDMLLTYTSDMSDDEMENRTSVKRKYSDEDDDVDGAEGLQTVENRLPPPTFQIANEVPGEEHIDDPALYQGRARTFAHVRGNWPSFIYVPCKIDFPSDMLVEINKIAAANGIASEFFGCDSHISLSKTFVLRHHWIKPVVDTIKECIQNFMSFIVVFGNLNAYCNEEKTRTFLSIEVRSGYDTLLNIVKTLEKNLAEFNFPEFYEDPSFHVSIAWCNGDYKDQLIQALPALEEYFHDILEQQELTYVQHIESSIGNKIHQYYLKGK